MSALTTGNSQAPHRPVTPDRAVGAISCRTRSDHWLASRPTAPEFTIAPFGTLPCSALPDNGRRTGCAASFLRALHDAAPYLRRRWLWGPKLRDALKSMGRWTVQVVKRSDAAEGFEIQHRTLSRWLQADHCRAADGWSDGPSHGRDGAAAGQINGGNNRKRRGPGPHCPDSTRHAPSRKNLLTCG